MINQDGVDPEKLEEATSQDEAIGEMKPVFEEDENDEMVDGLTMAQKDKAPAKKGAKPAKDAAPAKKKEEGPEDYAKPGSLPFADLWGSDVKYSDQIANGDVDDDKEIEDEDDPNDIIVDDNGFVNQWEIDHSKAAQWVQLDSDIHLNEAESKRSKNRFSEELVDGSTEDNKELTDLNDQNDEDVDENMILEDDSLLQLNENEAEDKIHGRGFANPGPAWSQIMAQVSSNQSINHIF